MLRDALDAPLVMLIGDANDELCHEILPGLMARRFSVLRTRVPAAPRVLQQAHVDAIVAAANPASADAFSPAECAELRTRHETPILVLAAAGVDSEAWRDAGASGVLGAPFELDAIADALYPLIGARTAGHIDSMLHGPDGLLLDVVGRRAFALGHALSLTRLEFDLLQCLLARRGEVVSADTLATQVWEYSSVGGRNYIETQISRVRAKLRAVGLGHAIVTVRGVGYVVR